MDSPARIDQQIATLQIQRKYAVAGQALRDLLAVLVPVQESLNVVDEAIRYSYFHGQVEGSARRREAFNAAARVFRLAEPETIDRLCDDVKVALRAVHADPHIQTNGKERDAEQRLESKGNTEAVEAVKR